MDGAAELEAWKKAAFLHERHVPDSGEAMPPSLLEQSEQRLQAWRKSTLGDEESFRERLRSVDLDEASFARRLALGTARPEALGWVPLLREVLEDRHPGVALRVVRESEESQRMHLPGFTRRFLQLGLVRLRAGVADVASRRGVAEKLLATGAQEELLEALEQRLLAQATRALVLELNVARMMDRLRGATPRERYEDFGTRYFDEPGPLVAFLEEYPVLARLLVTSFERWLEMGLELVDRLARDRARLGELFLGGADVGALVSVRTGAGDVHRAGRSVALLTFSSGLRLVYKPRSLDIEVRYQELLRRLNEGGARHAHRVLTVLERGDYGWVEYVQTGGCDSREAVERFYWRQGSHLALLHLTRAVDFHYGNLLAAGEYPVLVDLEGLFHHRAPFDLNETALHRTAAMLDQSVLSIGLLPTLFFGRDGREGVDLSGLGGEAGQVYPHRVATVEDKFQDTMRVVRGRASTPGANNRPQLEGQPVDVSRFADCIVQGFQETYLWLAGHRDVVREWLSGLADVEVRHIARPTMRYGFFLQESHHPDFLRDALERDQALDKLWAEASVRPSLRRLVPSEHEDLRLGDIPAFSTRPGQRHTWDSRGRCIPDYFPRSSLDESLELLERMDARACETQVALIRQSLVTIDKDREGRHPKGASAPTGLAPATPEECLAAAVELGEHLASTAIHGANDVCWMGVSVQDLDEWRWMLAPLGATLYDGVGGLALFYGYLAALTGRKDFASLARKALEPVRQQWRTPSEWDLSGVGAFAGSSSHIYVLSHLAGLLQDPALLEELHAGLGALESRIDADLGLDVSSGVAGCALVLLRLYRQTGHPEALRLAQRCGERLLATARPARGGLGWRIPASTLELAGLAHGAAGFAWALLELATATGDERLREAARQALVFERTLFSPEHGNWRDLRTTREDGTGGSDVFLTAWCNGASGVVLARLLSLPYLDDAHFRSEIAVGLETVEREGFGGSHCLCHGDVGNLEILHLTGELLGEEEWKQRALSRAAWVLAQGRSDQWRCGLPRYNETPGLMLGLSGIGLGLLRLAAPAFVPSVLALEPFRARPG